MHRSVELHLHRGGPFVLAMCATLVYLAASLWVPRVSPARLRPPLLSPLSYPLSISVWPPVLVSPFSIAVLFPSCPTRALEKLAARPLEPQHSHEQCTSALVCRAARFKFR